MPRYNFVCEPNEQHKETVYREVFMSISTFSAEGQHQICDRCGKEMRHILGMPAVIYKGKGFHSTDYPKRVPQDRQKEMLKELEKDYIEQAFSSGAVDEARDRTETMVIDQYRNEKTGEKVNKPVYIPAIED